MSGTSDRPRATVFRSNRWINLQVVDDTAHKTVFSLTDRSLKSAKGTKSQRAMELGKAAGEALIKNGVTSVVFDRAGFRYHGRVKAVADGLRAGGVKV